VYDLAGQRPVTELSVAELCREAGVTRDTFYRHAASPVGLLADVLREELEAVAGAHPELGGGFRPDAGMRAGVRALLEHVAQHQSVYRNATRPHLLGPLRDVLEAVIRASLTAHAQRYPEILPPEAVSPDDVAVLAAYAAAGTVGALEEWLKGGPPDVDRGERLVVAGSPAFWHGPVGRDDPGAHQQEWLDPRFSQA
jgi:AcrR family transcriptional regulator